MEEEEEETGRSSERGKEEGRWRTLFYYWEWSQLLVCSMAWIFAIYIYIYTGFYTEEGPRDTSLDMFPPEI